MPMSEHAAAGQGKSVRPAALALAAGCTLAAFVLFPVTYLISDDYLLNYIANGSYGAADSQYLLYPNILCGYLLKGLYAVAGGVNWYAVLLIAILIAAFAMAYCCIWSAGQSKAALCMAAGVNLLTPFFFTFTVVAGVANAAGFFALARLAEKQSRRAADWAAALCMVAAGYLLRPSMMVAIVCLCAPVFLQVYLAGRSGPGSRPAELGAAVCVAFGLYLVSKSSQWMAAAVCGAAAFLLAAKCGPRVRSLALAGGGLVLALAAARGCHLWCYSQGSWAAFRTYTSARSYVVDYPFVEYNDYAGAFGALGITRVDYDCIRQWTFCDRAVFSEQTLRALAKATPVSQRYLLDLGALVRQAVTGAQERVLFGLSAAACGATLFFSPKSKRYGILFTGGCVWILLASLLVRQRFVLRAAVPIVAIGVLEMLCFTAHCEGRLALRRSICAVAVAGCALTFGAYGMQTAENVKIQAAKRGEYLPLLSYFKTEQDTLFAMETSLYNELYYEAVPVFRVRYTEAFSNVCKLGSGDSFSTRYYAQLQQFGVKDPENLMRSLALEPALRYVSRDNSLMTAYLTEQLGSVAATVSVTCTAQGCAPVTVCEYVTLG